MSVAITIPDCATCGHSGQHSPHYGCCECPRDRAMHAFRPVPMVGTNAAWDAIKAEADRLDWPRLFTSDLFRDWQVIMREGPGRPFVWSVRSTGTDMIGLNQPTEHDRRDAALYVRVSQRYNTESRWYVWNGSALLAVSPSRAVDVVDRAEEV